MRVTMLPMSPCLGDRNERQSVGRRERAGRRLGARNDLEAHLVAADERRIAGEPRAQPLADEERDLG